MPIDSKHPEYEKHRFQWQKCRDVADGEDAVKAQKMAYLQMLSGQDPEDYEGYLRRASLYEATGRTVAGLSGAILRKDPTIEFPDPDLIESMGADGAHASLIVKQAIDELLTTGRVGLYVDSETGDGDEGPDPNALPYVCVYYAENILNWAEEIVNGRKVLTWVVLLENNAEHPIGGDDYDWVEQERYRILRLEGAGTPDPYLQVEVWERDEEAKERNQEMGKESGEDGAVEEWKLVEQVIPTFRGGRKIPYIPFVIINPSTLGTKVEKSPILGLVNMNLAHFRNSADYEHGLHFTALPTAWVAGFDPQTTRLRVGSQVAWVSENPQARAGFLEFSGQGLSSIEKAMTKKEQLMAILGARLLEAQKADAEAAAAIRLRHAGEESVLLKLVDSVQKGMTLVLLWLAEWIGSPGAKISVDINKDFNPLGLDYPTLVGLMQALQSGGISWSTWFWNLKRGELIPDGRTEDEEKQLIEAGFPILPLPDLTQDQSDKGGGGKMRGGGGSDNVDLVQP